jgi:hypothetical protein
VEINKGSKMPPGFCRPARRERGAYPPRSATSEQRSWAAKEQGRLLPFFVSTALGGGEGQIPGFPSKNARRKNRRKFLRRNGQRGYGGIHPEY